MSNMTRSTDHAAEARKLLEVAAREVSLDMAAAAQGAAQTHALLELADKVNEARWALLGMFGGGMALGIPAGLLLWNAVIR